MQQLEQKLDDLLVKKAPYQLPTNAKEGLVKAMPYLALLGGVLMLLAAWGLYQVVSILGVYGAYWAAFSSVSPLVWVALGMLVVQAVLFFLAYPELVAKHKKGWNLLFWAAILNAIESVVQLIAYSNPGALLGSLLGTVIGLYLLFQVRSYYTGAATVASTPAAPAPKDNSNPPETKKE